MHMHHDDKAEWCILRSIVCCISAKILFIWDIVILQHNKTAVWSLGHYVHELYMSMYCLLLREHSVTQRKVP